MKHTFFLLAILCLLPHHAPASEPHLSLVYDGKEDKYEVVRTPQLLVTKAGTLLAFAQGRSGSHDRSINDIILKRSTDGGQTWSKQQVIAGKGADSLASICVIQLSDTGRVFVIGSWFPAGYEFTEFQYLSPAMQDYQRKMGHDALPAIKPGHEGPAIARNYIITRDDDGVTWSAMREITREVKRPTVDLACVPGPGVAIRLHAGPHTGRIVVPCYTRYLDTAQEKPGYRDVPYAVFSDDGGLSWKRGELAPVGESLREKSGGETQMLELPGGSVMLNTRAAGRNTATSQDGGQTWSPLKEETAIKTTPTAAGFIRFSGLSDDAKSRLLFSNPTEAKRKRGVISLSYDDGRTWPVQKTLRPGRFSYSTLARLPDGQIGCLFDSTAEKGEFPGHTGSAILLARFSLDWLTDDKDHLP